jgi:hypothetical protein
MPELGVREHIWNQRVAPCKLMNSDFAFTNCAFAHRFRILSWRTGQKTNCVQSGKELSMGEEGTRKYGGMRLTAVEGQSKQL